MKRSPLKRGTSQLKRTPIKRVSTKRAAESRIHYQEKKVAFADMAAAQGYPGQKPRCERCVDWGAGPTRLATDWHHWWPVGQGGPYRGGQMICLCRPCHDWIHQNPKPAREEGWLK
jgi:hypothetical protein